MLYLKSEACNIKLRQIKIAIRQQEYVVFKSGDLLWVNVIVAENVSPNFCMSELLNHCRFALRPAKVPPLYITNLTIFWFTSNLLKTPRFAHRYFRGGNPRPWSGKKRL